MKVRLSKARKKWLKEQKRVTQDLLETLRKYQEFHAKIDQQ